MVEYEPDAHGMHVFMFIEPAPEEYVPCSHDTQVDWFMAPCLVEYDPASHSVHQLLSTALTDVENVP